MLMNEACQYYDDLLTTEYLESTTEILARHSNRNELTSQGRPVCNILRPYFMDSQIYDHLKHATTLVKRGINTLYQRLLADEILRRELGLTEQEEGMLLFECEPAPEMRARLDGFFDMEGNIKFVEYNGNPGGLLWNEAYSNIFSDMPIMKAFSARYHCRTFPTSRFALNALRQALPDTRKDSFPSIAVIGRNGYNEILKLNGEEIVGLNHYFQLAGCSIDIVDPEEIGYLDDRIYINGNEIDFIFLAFPPDPGNPVFELINRRNVHILNGPHLAMLGKKALFALLSDNKHANIFDRDIAEALKRYIPWTRLVREGKTYYQDKIIDLLPFIAENREQFVLKPNSGFGSGGVVLGWEVDNDKWQETLKKALKSQYVVQERVKFEKKSFPKLSLDSLDYQDYFISTDPYIWSGINMEGAIIRLSQRSLINVTAGGSVTPLIVINKK